MQAIKHNEKDVNPITIQNEERRKGKVSDPLYGFFPPLLKCTGLAWLALYN